MMLLITSPTGEARFFTGYPSESAVYKAGTHIQVMMDSIIVQAGREMQVDCEKPFETHARLERGISALRNRIQVWVIEDVDTEPDRIFPHVENIVKPKFIIRSGPIDETTPYTEVKFDSSKYELENNNLPSRLDEFGCRYCAGMGYMDYPSTQRPCPIPGHKERYEANLRTLNRSMESMKKPYTPDCGDCPYCLAAGRKVGIDCIHWTGSGWSKVGRKTNG